MRFFAIDPEFSHAAAMQRFHEIDLRHHRITAAAAQHQHLNSRLPFRQGRFLLRQADDVGRCVLEGDQLTAFGSSIGLRGMGRTYAVDAVRKISFSRRGDAANDLRVPVLSQNMD